MEEVSSGEAVAHCVEFCRKATRIEFEETQERVD